MANASPSLQLPGTPGMPLFPLSPERVNKQTHAVTQSPLHPIFPPAHELSQSGILAGSNFSYENEVAAFKTPPSPSRQENISPFGKSDGARFSPPKHTRNNSDVQGMVARFNSLDIRDRTEEMRKRDAAALTRAQMGREEAEADVRRLKEENRAQQREIEDGKERQRIVVKRLDVIMEDLHRSKETQAHAQILYEKEIRRARKEAFKSSSMMVKLQEELKAARITLKLLSSDLDVEKMKVNKREQDTFSAQYQLVGVQEELAGAQAQIKVVQEERDALKMSLKEEEVARIALEGRIALPPARAEDDDFPSPKKQKPQLSFTSPEKEPSRSKIELDQLRADLEEQRSQRLAVEEQVEFMKMECQFGCCSCRIGERQGARFIHDGEFEAEVLLFKTLPTDVPTPPDSVMIDEERVESGAIVHDEGNPLEPSCDTQLALHNEADAPEGLVFSPTSGTFRKPTSVPEPTYTEAPFAETIDAAISNVLESRHSHENHVNVEESRDVLEVKQVASPSESQLDNSKPLVSNNGEAEPPLPGRLSSSKPQVGREAVPIIQSSISTPETQLPIQASSESPQTPLTSNWRTTTTTTKVPLADAASTDYSAFCSPHITREEAIEQLRRRRGRARSIAGTPKKTGTDAYTPRRDISAPEVRAPGSQNAAKRSRSVVRGRPAMR